MSFRDPNDTEQDEPSTDDVAREDWNRYGLSHREPLADQRDALGRPLEPADRVGRVGEEPLLDYRSQNRKTRHSRPARPPRSSRFVADVAVLSAVGVIGAIVLVYALVSSSLMPAPSPTPRPSPTPTGPVAVTNEPFSANPGESVTLQSADVGILINLPMDIAIADRDQPPDDGTLMYLTGPNGGVSVNPADGKIGTVYGGSAFAKGVRRAVVDSGLWVSSWPADTKSCGASCWSAAATYRIDLATGSITNALAATYLLGATSDGVWVASGGNLQQLDPSTGDILSTTPWFGDGEPRLGCGSLWSFTPGSGGATLAEIDPGSGTDIGQSLLDPAVTYGPTLVEGQCWMMSGSAGASAGTTTLVWLNTDGTTQAVLGYPGKSIVTLDHEFWQYSSDKTMRRFEATSGYGYGVSYQLKVRPSNDDPEWFFAAAGTLWLLDGKQLAGFDVHTGTSRVNG
ncbi:MAG: hypothetical protein ABSE58_07655 [Candidatus Limnocylindrales bacterium]